MSEETDFNVIRIETGILIDKNVRFLTFEHEHTIRSGLWLITTTAEDNDIAFFFFRYVAAFASRDNRLSEEQQQWADGKRAHTQRQQEGGHL